MTDGAPERGTDDGDDIDLLGGAFVFLVAWIGLVVLWGLTIGVGDAARLVMMFPATVIGAVIVVYGLVRYERGRDGEASS